MTPEELMKPRYKVIATWFKMPLKIEVGDIIQWDDLTEDFYCKGERFNKDLHSYPHLMQPLQWWEERKESDMPEYVKEYEPIEGGGGITYVYKNRKDFKYLTAANCIGLRMSNDKRMIHYQYLEPATEAEYTTQKKQTITP